MRRSVVVLVAFVFATVADAQDRRPLQHDDVDKWIHITDREISDDGKWVLWHEGPDEGDGVLHVRHTSGDVHHIVERGSSPRFTGDGSLVVFLREALFDSTRQAQIDEKDEEDLPPDSVGYLNLLTGDVALLDPAVSFKVSEDAGSWFAYKLTEKASAPDSVAADSAAASKSEEEVGNADTSEVKTPDKPDTATLVVFGPSSGTSVSVENVDEYALAGNGRWMAFTRSSEDGDADGAFVLDAGASEPRSILGGEGRYMGLSFDESGEQLAFVSDRDHWPGEHPAVDIYLTKYQADEASKVVAARHASFPEGWRVSEHGELEFSDSGARLFFGTAPEPVIKEEQPELTDDETIKLDIWSWKDPLLQPNQLVQAESEKKRSYRAVLHIDENDVVQLADETVPDITLSDKGDGIVALGESGLPYRQRISWDSPRYQDVVVVDTRSGRRTTVFTDRQVNANLSPEGRYVYWWDGHEKAWFAWDTSSREEINLTGALGPRFDNHLADRPMIPGPEGSAGWSEGDKLFLVYDKYDVWGIDPKDPADARNLTEGIGRAENRRYRILDLDPDEDALADQLMLDGFDYGSKEQGLYADNIRGDSAPRQLVGGAYSFRRLDKAKDAEVYMFSRESFREYPEVWVAGAGLENPRALSDVGNQQDAFTWGTAELVQWTSLDGQKLDGVLYKPDGFDPGQKYPLMVYFYEKLSSTLFSHYVPRPSRSSINRSFYVSRGYLLFVPDIPYKNGYPGESAMNAIMPGITSLMDAGYVDEDRIGIQGHSWGGYQIAYMVTQTNLFAAAEAGAPVSNMTSAYGGIRWASGLSRMFQYEKTQSRIGGTLWDAQHRYIDNSPLFQADKVTTPLLMMHNDEDGAVPWYQGIEYFVALRRLGRPVWLLNYNGEAHGLRNLHNQRDWAIRMQQFFDHYLMDAPAPVWLEDGVPAVKKGETLGLELKQ